MLGAKTFIRQPQRGGVDSGTKRATEAAGARAGLGSLHTAARRASGTARRPKCGSDAMPTPPQAVTPGQTYYKPWWPWSLEPAVMGICPVPGFVRIAELATLF